MTDILLNAGRLITLLWGAMHIAPTRMIVAGFGALTYNNHQIILMEWIAEGLTMMFIAVLVIAVNFADGPGISGLGILVHRICAGMLLMLAGWSLTTGARTSILPMKICPVVKTVAAIMLITATVI